MTETIKEITKRIEENSIQLLKQLSDEYEVRKADLTAQLEALNTVERDLANAREFIENLCRYGTDTQLMSAKRNIVSQTKQLLNIETKVDPVADEFMVFRPSDDYFERKSLGKVQLTEYTLEDVPEFLRTGDDVCVALEVKGREDMSVNKISSEIIDPTNKKETMTVEDHKNGTFSLRCRVKIEGDHKMTVSVCKQLVYSSHVKVIPKKGFLFEFGEKSAGEDGLNWPCGVTLDTKGNIVVCEKGKGAITQFSPFKDGFHAMASAHNQNSEQYKPLYVALSADQNLHFVTEDMNRRVLVFKENMKLIRGFKGKISSPTGIAVNPTNKRVYVADDVSHCIHICDEDGDPIKSFGHHGRGKGKLKSPEGVCVNRDGNVIVSDHDNNRVQVFDADGEFLFAFGDEGNGQGQIKCPCGVTTDKHNNVYVCDNGKQRVLKFDPKGNYICRIDNGEVSDPRDVCVTDDEPFGKVIVSDFAGDCIKVFAQ
ncbi:E3 ubiquitin-protein ligase TRIM71-like [Ptychodera flava]|uniref:E3 ubiquitin-protein ligase TRIM71-like n=1 Tax=Ptychodera flava TaxID=63121 RepID=UPI003969F6A4